MWAEISVSETVVSKNSLVVGGVVDGYGGGAGHASGDDGDATVRKSKAVETGRKTRGVKMGRKVSRECNSNHKRGVQARGGRHVVD